jgi:hypothetical protein
MRSVFLKIAEIRSGPISKKPALFTKKSALFTKKITLFMAIVLFLGLWQRFEVGLRHVHLGQYE